jgi:hypothetical protein
MADPNILVAGFDGTTTRVLRTDGAGNLRVSGDAITTGQVTVTTAATVIAAARAGRRSITIVNEGTTDMRIGGAGVTTANGLLLSGVKGQTLTIETAAAVFGIVGAGSQTVSFVENY